MIESIKQQTEEEANNQLKYPSQWSVYFHNDDVTPMGFVAYLLKEIFKYKEASAIDLVMKIQKEGKVAVGTYIKSVAEAKMLLALSVSNHSGYPLKITMEKEV